MRPPRRFEAGLVVRGVAAAGAAVLLASCSADDGPQTREVLVDYVHDEVAASFIAYFPRDVVVRPGDTVRFEQKWTGEPHSVTLGHLVDEMMGTVVPLIEEYGDREEEDVPEDVLATYYAAIEALPPMIGEEFQGGPVNQNAAQPCYLEDGAPPENPMTSCTPEQQVQPAFNGRQSFYNSGYIHYRGEGGNVFEVPLADDIEPGVYNYYCNFHGAFQAGTITVVAPDERIPSQAEVARQAKREIDRMADPLIAAVEEARGKERATIDGLEVRQPYAGWYVENPESIAYATEFIPAQQRVEVGDAVTWSFIGAHTVSFNPPDYFSELLVEDDGTVIFSADALEPRGGPGPPTEPPDEDGEYVPPAVVKGPWDGEGFLSSGLLFDGTYSVTFTQPGTYRYACLIHPQMVGTVIVE